MGSGSSLCFCVVRCFSTWGLRWLQALVHAHQIPDRAIKASKVLRQLGIVRRFLHNLNDNRAASPELLKCICRVTLRREYGGDPCVSDGEIPLPGRIVRVSGGQPLPDGETVLIGGLCFRWLFLL